MQDLIPFIVTAAALVGSPRPATLSLAAVGAAFGPRRGSRHLVGLFIAMLVVIGVTASGVTAAVLAIPGAAPVLGAASAAYLIYLAWKKIATAPPLGETAYETKGPSVLGGLLLSFANPKGYAAMVALFSGFTLITGEPMADTALKCAIVLPTMLALHIAWMFIGAALTRLFRDARVNRMINISFAVLLLASVALAVLI